MTVKAEGQAPKVWGKKELLDSRNRLARELVSLPDGSGAVWCQEVTGTQRDQWESGIAQIGGKNNRYVQLTKNNYRGALIALGATDAEGKRLFNTLETEELKSLPSSISDCLYEAIARLSGISKRDQEEMEKNLESDQEDFS